jgi:threonine dehydrogenase-like Zn-dependent dehydrogenase
MKAAVFVEPGRIELVSKPIPSVGPNDALIRITTTTICGTDVHILKGEYPVAKGLTVGHEPVGVIEKLGSAVVGYTEGQRVIAGAICPNFNSYAAQDGAPSQDGSYLIPQGMCGCHGFKATAGWRFGNLIDGTQAEYVLVPDAQANLAPIPDGLTDEQVLMCPDIMSTGFKGAENANIRIGDTVVVFAQGPHWPVRHGRCAPAGRHHHHRGGRQRPPPGHCAEDGRRCHAELQELRCDRRDHEDHRWPRCRFRHRGAGHAGHI